MTPRAALLVSLFVAFAELDAQSGEGLLVGVAADELGRPVAGEPVTLQGAPPDLTLHTVSRATGEFSLALPYGEYRVSALGAEFTVMVSPLRPVCMRIAPSGGAQIPCPGDVRPWSAQPDGAALAPLLLAREPTTVAEPLDFSWPAFTAFPLLSQRAFSWTTVRYTLDGADSTDPYQPGRDDAVPDAAAIQEAGLRSGLDLGASPAYGSEIAAFVQAPGAVWRGAASTEDTGAALAADNLPAVHGPVQQTAKYQRFSSDSLQLGGPLGRRVEVFGSILGQWSSQTAPLAAPGSDLQRSVWSGAALVRVAATARDRLQFDFDGSRVQQPDWCMPAGIEAWAGRPMAPSATIPSIEGFAGCAEHDGFRSFQAAWSRAAAEGLWQARGGASWADLNTASAAPAGAQSIIDMATGATNGVAPLTNLGARARQFLDASYARPYLRTGSARHAVALGAGWDRAAIRNRFAEPGGMNLITANGAPAFAILFNTPQDSSERIANFRARARDAIAVAPWLTADVGAVADLARGGAVAWNAVSPRAGIALTPPGFRRVTVRAGWARLYAPLAGRYLDFGNAASLGGAEYQWHGRERARGISARPIGAAHHAIRRPACKHRPRPAPAALR